MKDRFPRTFTNFSFQAMEIVETICEQAQTKPSALMEEIGLETDEEAVVDMTADDRTTKRRKLMSQV